MKILTNPTDDELNWAFTLNVSKLAHPMTGEAIKPDDYGVVAPPTYTESMDAVLPWLEKFVKQRTPSTEYEADVSLDAMGIEWGWRATLSVRTARSRDNHMAFSPDPARACVLALLKAHGVEVKYEP